jgi:hypothetical protein
MSKKAFDKIAAGLNGALAVARGTAKPSRLHVPPEIENTENEFKKMGRLAMREEGEFWVAYYALPDTMEDAKPLGTIRLRFVQDQWRKEFFMELMKEAIGDLVEEATGRRPLWPDGPKAAPEHERTKK